MPAAEWIFKTEALAARFLKQIKLDEIKQEIDGQIQIGGGDVIKI